MRTGPGEERSAGAAGYGHLRASHTDRDQVIGTLKAAFVQGRLAKDEFELRVGATLASRTYAELAALTADLPAGLADTGALGRMARARPWRPMNDATKAGVRVVIAVAVPMVLLFLTGSAVLFLMLTPFYFMGLAFLCAEMAASRLKTRSIRGQLPPGPASGPGSLASPHLPSAGPGGHLPPPDPGQRHTAATARRRLPRPALLVRGQCAGGALAAGTAPANE